MHGETLKFLDIFYKQSSSTKHNENPFSGSRVFSCRQTDMT